MFSDLLPITDVRWQRWHKKCGKANAAGAIHHEADAERLPVRQRFDAVDVANAMMADHEGVAVRALLTIELAWLCA